MARQPDKLITKFATKAKSFNKNINWTDAMECVRALLMAYVCCMVNFQCDRGHGKNSGALGVIMPIYQMSDKRRHRQPPPPSHDHFVYPANEFESFKFSVEWLKDSTLSLQIYLSAQMALSLRLHAHNTHFDSLPNFIKFLMTICVCVCSRLVLIVNDFHANEQVFCCFSFFFPS